MWTHSIVGVGLLRRPSLRNKTGGRNRGEPSDRPHRRSPQQQRLRRNGGTRTPTLPPPPPSLPTAAARRQRRCRWRGPSRRPTGEGAVHASPPLAPPPHPYPHPPTPGTPCRNGGRPASDGLRRPPSQRGGRPADATADRGPQGRPPASTASSLEDGGGTARGEGGRGGGAVEGGAPPLPPPPLPPVPFPGEVSSPLYGTSRGRTPRRPIPAL